MGEERGVVAFCPCAWVSECLSAWVPEATGRSPPSSFASFLCDVPGPDRQEDKQNSNTSDEGTGTDYVQLTAIFISHMCIVQHEKDVVRLCHDVQDKPLDASVFTLERDTWIVLNTAFVVYEAK